jgi:hypothetical protein
VSVVLCGALFASLLLSGLGLVVHMSSIPGRTQGSLTPPVVGPPVVGKGVGWVDAAGWGRLEGVPGGKAAGRGNR